MTLDPSKTRSRAIDEGRRRFFGRAASIGAGLALGAVGEVKAAKPPADSPAPTSGLPSGEQPRSGPDAIPRRAFGKTDVKVSALGMGGHHLGEFKSVDQAIELVRRGLEAGIDFFDNCWEYFNGKTEDWLGRALEGRREKAFLMTKVCTHGRGARLALEMLEQSLRRLRTDHLDLWQVHGVSFDNDPDLAYAKGGVLEALDKAKQQGKTRFVGFTGHKDPHIHLKMITLGFRFDAVQMPLNPFDATFRSFERIVLPEANRRGIAVLGMKSMGGTAEATKRGVVTPEQLLRYAMSLPVAVTISGMDSLDVLEKNLAVARGFQPLPAAEMESLRKKCAEPAADGRFEPYKVSLKFDNPEARLAHGFPIDDKQKEVQQMFKEGAGTWITE